MRIQRTDNRSMYLLLPALLLAFTFPVLTHAQSSYVQTNLVANEVNLPGSTSATGIDPNLVNPWGMVQGSKTPFWVSDQVTNVATGYKLPVSSPPAFITVSIPTATTPPNGPTGIVFNTGTGFPLPTPSGSKTPTVASFFMFANLNGQLSGWNPGSTGGFANAVTAVTTPGAAYTGLAINATGSLIYAANYTSGNAVNVFNSSWTSQGTIGTLSDLSSAGITLASNYAPYNVTNVNGTLFMAYDPLQTSGTFAGKLPQLGDGNGAVIEYNPSTSSYTELVAPGSGNGLNVPWGFAMAPANWGKFGDDLLVGNFGSGWISAYNSSGVFQGYVSNASGTPLWNPALWTLDFGNGAGGTNANTLYITAGLTQPFQSKGLMAAIDPSPEPAALDLFATGLLSMGMLMLLRRRRRAGV